MPMMMGNIPPALLAMFGPAGAASPATPPIRMGRGGVNLAEPGPPGVGASGIPSAPMPRGAAFGPISPAPMTPTTPTTPMKSSDDPGITGMPALPTPPDISKSPVVPVNNQYQADLAKRAAFGPGPSPQDYKPSTGRRIGGGLLGALSGGLASIAGETPKEAVSTGTATGSRFTNRAFNQAQGKYQRGTSALDKQLEAERGGFPIAEAAGKLPQEDFTNKMGVARENREQKVGQGRIDSSEARADEQRTRADQLQNLIDHPKTTPPKNADEALAQAYLETDPTKRSTLMAAATALHKQEIERAQQSRPPKEGTKPATRNQFREVDDRRASADAKAEAEFEKETKDIDLTSAHNASGKNPEQDTAYAADKARYDRAAARLEQAKKTNERAYYEDIRDLGGTTPDGPSKPGADKSQPTSQPSTDTAKPTPVKELQGHKVGDTVKLKGKPVTITQLYSDGSFDHEPAGGSK